MAVPGMFFPPVIMNKLEQRPLFRNNKVVNALTMVGLTGVCLSFSTPLCCALFPQRSSMAVSALEPELQETIRQRTFKKDPVTHVFYNKGL
ncbi:hypothetical protein PC115_g10149 [Phytophthora cactorum]|nr:hypothetical protein PC115_g10149 [Phytophthora cactorum]